ncbi:MAG: hypothetical protein LBC37_04150 [Zoogloeaceae bacterium]|jgi:hypothetical protein|nr:hypothetical protein [Zoogloeaceae bacterium]
MEKPRLPPHDARQSGAAALVLLLLLILGALGWFLSAFPAQALKNERAARSAEALFSAKEALLGYAAAYPESRPERQHFVPGHLPCPDTGNALENEGAESGACGGKGVSVLGHFPWRSLGVPPPRDGSGECLWYAVSGNYKVSPKADLLNPDTAGLIKIVAADGHTLLADEVVAVLFAPGAPLDGQTRQYIKGECRWDYAAQAFLDTTAGIANGAPNEAAEGESRFLVAETRADFNDQLLWITRDELFSYVRARLSNDALFAEELSDTADTRALTQRVAACLMRFGEHNAHRRLPWASPLNMGAGAPDTFHYEKFYDKENLLAGRAPYAVARSQNVLHSTLGDWTDCAANSQSIVACRLLIAEKCADFAPVAGGDDSRKNSKDGWWDKWKDHLFYVVSPGFAPMDAPAADCAATPEKCLRVNGVAYAAAVIFSGETLAGQTRATRASRMLAANYLEGMNAQTLQNGGQTLEIAGNDQIACIAGPDATHPGFRLVANCGQQDCRQRAENLRACLENAKSDCAAPHAALEGCACKGAADTLRSEKCQEAAAVSTPVCRNALADLRGCAA